jgi:hypothetical protein
MADDQQQYVEEIKIRQVRRQFADPEITSRIHEVPPEPRRSTGPAPRAGFESGLVFLFFAVVYAVVGYFMLTEGRIVSFISLDHLNEAYMVWWNDPPRLAALGLDASTFSSIVYMPFALIKPFATSLVALPVMSAIAAGLLMASLNNLMRVCGMNLGFRLVLLLLFGLNPMTVYYAGNGDPVILGMVMLAIAITSVIAWQVTDQTRHLAAAGLAMGLAVMVDYMFILISVGFLCAFMVIGAASKHDQGKLRASLLLFLTPVVYSLLFWCLLNWVLLGNPFEWISAQNGVIQVNTNGALQEVGTTFADSLGDLFTITLGTAPLALVVGILLIVVGILRRDAVSWALLFVGLAVAAAPVLRAVVADQADLLSLSYGLPIAVFTFGAVAALGRANDNWSAGVAVFLGLGLIAAIPLSWNVMGDYRYQNQEQAFTRWVEDQESQEGKRSLGGYQNGIDPELAMANYINNEIPQAKRSILVDPNFSYGVMITSGRPQNFFDRVDQGEDDWQAAIDNPWLWNEDHPDTQVRYMLVTTSRAGDQLAKKWPLAVEGGEAGMEPIFRTDRYVLVEISETRPADSAGGEDDDAPQTSPNPVTPVSPINPNGPSLTTPSEALDTTPTSPVPSTGDTVEPNNGSSSAPALEGE